MPDHVLIYEGKLPAMNVQAPDWRKRWRLKQACLKQFGIWPMPATQFAHVTMTRVLGPRERVFDSDNLAYACKAIRDSLTNQRRRRDGTWGGGGNYIVDDDPRHAVFTYLQDTTRRHEGPTIEITIVYRTTHQATAGSPCAHGDHRTTPL